MGLKTDIANLFDNERQGWRDAFSEALKHGEEWTPEEAVERALGDIQAGLQKLLDT